MIARGEQLSGMKASLAGGVAQFSGMAPAPAARMPHHPTQKAAEFGCIRMTRSPPIEPVPSQNPRNTLCRTAMWHRDDLEAWSIRAEAAMAPLLGRSPGLADGPDRMAARLCPDGRGPDRGQPRRCPAQPGLGGGQGSDPQNDRAGALPDGAGRGLTHPTAFDLAL